MKIKDIKDAKTWSINDIDAVISERKKIIEDMETDLCKLREIKLQKIFEEIKPKVIENKIDFSLDDVQQLLFGKNDAETDNKIHKQKNKSTRSKKSSSEKKTDDIVPENNATENATIEDEAKNSTSVNSEKMIEVKMSDSESKEMAKFLGLPEDVILDETHKGI